MLGQPGSATPNRPLARLRAASIAASPAVTAVARMERAKILLKHADRSIFRPILVREIPMPRSKPQLSLQSPSQTPQLLLQRRRQAHQQPPLNTAPSELTAAVSRTSGWSLGEQLRAAARVGAAARRACVSSSVMLLSWLVREFLDGCAAYALAMYGIPTSLDGRLIDVAEAKPPQADLAHGAAPRRPPVAVVIRPAQAHDDRQSHR